MTNLPLMMISKGSFSKAMSPRTRKLLLMFISILAGGSLSVLCLFNLPLFYEQDKFGFVTTFFVVFILSSVIIGYFIHIVLIPVEYIKEKSANSIFVIILLGLLLFSVFYTTSVYYWSIPYVHYIEICYQSNTPSGNLKILEISNSKTERLYQAEIFSHKKYPFTMQPGTCIKGDIRSAQNLDGISIVFEEKTGNSLLIIEVNGYMTEKAMVVKDNMESSETFSVSQGLDYGTLIYPNIFSHKLLTIIKWVALITSSIFLAFLIFGLVEAIVFYNIDQIISYKIALVLVLTYFIGFGILMVNHSGQPDQRKHTYFSARYSETWGVPEEDPFSPFFMRDNVYLYYWLNGAVIKVYHWLTPNPEEGSFSQVDLLILRLFSLTLSTGTLIYVYKLTFKVTENRLGGVLAAFFCANMLMFVFVSGGVSFDNFVSLSSAAAIYHMVCILKREDYTKNTALMGIWLGLGGLSKNEGALLAFILFLIWLGYSIHNRKTLEFNFVRANIILIILLSITSGLFLEFYGGNLIQYRRPIPRCEQIKSEENCTRFASRRSERQKVDPSELWTNRNIIVGPFEYALNFWSYHMVNGIWGIISHKTYVPKFLTSLHGCLIIWSIFCMVRYWRREDMVTTVLLVTILGYVGYVFFLNYRSELVFNFRHYAVQGRYLFPLLSPFLALTVKYFLSISSLSLKRMTLSMALIIYFAGGLGTFIFSYADVFISWRMYF